MKPKKIMIRSLSILTDYKKNIQDKIKESNLDEKAKIYINKSKEFSQDKDIKNKSKNYYEKFKSGLMNLERIPILITSFLLILILWIPMMYGSMTMSLLTGQDGMSNKELNALQQRLDERYERQLGE